VEFYFPDTPDIPLPEGHRFPAGKYRMVLEQVREGRILADAALRPSPPACWDQLLLAHDAGYVEAVFSGTLEADVVRRIGLPWSRTLAERSRITAGGSLAAARSALSAGVSGQFAGGTHHAHRDFGSGFCVFNDLSVAALALLAEGRVKRIAVLDTDVYQGDGNAAILGPDPRCFVISIHGEKNFPFRKVASDLDIGLADGSGDAAFLEALASALQAVARFEPDLVLYLSGADPLAADSLGRLALTHDGLAERDRRVFAFCRASGIPVSVVLGGGYSRPIDDTVRGYVGTFRMLREVFEV
jgi:acetoin utilization deacetylase AcuC-like enzyme